MDVKTNQTDAKTNEMDVKANHMDVKVEARQRLKTKYRKIFGATSVDRRRKNVPNKERQTDLGSTLETDLQIFIIYTVCNV